MSIKRNNGYMIPKIKTTKAKKLVCSNCEKELTPQTAYFYVDGNNCAITNNSPTFCKECYIKKYGNS